MPKESFKLDITIVGGTGWAGNLLATYLSHEANLACNVTVIDKKNYWCWNPVLPRVLSDPNAVGVATRPVESVTYSGVKKGGKQRFHYHESEWIHGEATKIDYDNNTVTVTKADGSGSIEVKHDLLVVATGSTYSGVYKPAAPTVEEADAQFNAIHKRMRASKHVMIVGHGPVGVETAAELRNAAGPVAEGGPKITLVGPGNPLKGSSKMAIRLVKKKLKGLDITLVDGKVDLNDIPDYPQDDVDGSGAHIVRTVDISTGSKVEGVDCIIKAAGVKVNTTLFANSPSMKGALDEDGHVKVDKTYRVIGFPRVVALGDIVKRHTKSGKAKPFPFKLAHVAEQQVNSLKGNLRSLSRLVVRKGGADNARTQIETHKLGGFPALYPQGLVMVTMGKFSGVVSIGPLGLGTLVHTLAFRGLTVYMGKACRDSKFKTRRYVKDTPADDE